MDLRVKQAPEVGFVGLTHILQDKKLAGPDGLFENTDEEILVFRIGLRMGIVGYRKIVSL